MAILTIQNINHSYRDDGNNSVVSILENVNLSIEQHEIIGLIGNSGSGKSTLLHIAGLIQSPNSGKIIIDEQTFVYPGNINDKQITNTRMIKIGFVHQFHYLFNDFTVLENLTIPQVILGINTIDAKKYAVTLLELIKMQHKVDSFPEMLSGGERQRIAVLRALCKRPRLVIADEPTGNLDPETGALVLNEMIALIQEYNACLLMATHNHDLIERFNRCYAIIDKTIAVSSLCHKKSLTLN